MTAQPLDRPSEALQGLAELGVLDSAEVAGKLLFLGRVQPLERINGYLGYGAVARLKFEQGRLPRPRPPALLAPQGLDPAEEKKLASDLGRIEDPELRQALEGLGRAVKGLRRHPNPAK